MVPASHAREVARRLPWTTTRLAAHVRGKSINHVRGPMMDRWDQIWQWTGQEPALWMLLPLIVVAVVTFVLATRDERTEKPTGPPS